MTPGIEILRQQAQTAVAAGDYPAAIALLGSVLSRAPDDYESIGLAGQVHMESGRYPEARDAFQAVLDVDPENVPARSGLAAIAEADGRPEEALELLETAWELDETHRAAGQSVQRLRAGLGVALPPVPRSAFHAIARRLQREGRHREAAAHFLDAIQAGQGTVEVQVGLAESLLLAGDVEDAGSLARKLLALCPDCLKGLAIAAAASASQDSEEAIALLARCEALNPGNGQARQLFQRAGLTFPACEGEPAERDAGADSGAAELTGSGAEADAPAGDEAATPLPAVGADAGVDLPREVRSLSPGHETDEETRRRERLAQEERRGDADLHIAFARSFERRGHPDFALSEYRKALRIHPGTAPTVAGSVRKLLEADPASLEARWLLADALATQGLLRQAMERYLSALNSGASESRPREDKEISEE